MLVDEPEHDRMLLEPSHHRGRVLGVVGRQIGHRLQPDLRGPALVGHHLHALDAERREHLGDVADERVVEDDHQHLVGPEAAAVLEGQVGQPVQADGGLAAAGAALDDHQARGRLADQLELARVDQRGDLAEGLVLAALVGVGADAEGRLVVLLRTHRRALATAELGGAGPGPTPGAVELADEGPLGRADPLEPALTDAQRAPNEHVALDLAVAEEFVVVVALFVAVVDAAHRRVAPVDDAHAGLRVEEGGATDEHLALALVLLEDQPAEVRRAGVHDTLADHRSALGDALQPLHLLDQRGHVLEAGGADLVAERDQLGVVVDELAPTLRGAAALLDGAGDPSEDLLLLGDDRLELFIALDGFGGWGRSGLAAVSLAPGRPRHAIRCHTSALQSVTG